MAISPCPILQHFREAQGQYCGAPPNHLQIWAILNLPGLVNVIGIVHQVYQTRFNFGDGHIQIFPLRCAFDTSVLLFPVQYVTKCPE